MDIQSRVRNDVTNIFSDFPEMEMTKIDTETTVESISCNALQSFITLTAETESGRDLKTDSGQVSINANNPLVQAFNPMEEDKVIIKDVVGNDRSFIIANIDRDRSTGIWLCDLEIFSTEEKKGVKNNADELIQLIEEEESDA